VPVSITPPELRQLVDGIRFIEKMNSNPVDKDQVAGDMSSLRDMFTKSLVARVDLKAGVLLREEHLQAKKPGTGIAASRLPELVGAKLRRDVKANELLQEADVEGMNA
jgi:N-acetylneuraminate synthase